jgi:CBS domain-containing protein
MKIENIMMPTKTATHNMSVREFINECTRANTPGLPFTTPSGRIDGRVTLKNIFKLSCLPEYIVESARILGDQLSCMEDIEAKAKQMMDNPVEDFTQGPHISISSNAATVKALAMMELNDTSYIFVVDDGQYRGVVTIQCLAKMLARLDQQG